MKIEGNVTNHSIISLNEGDVFAIRVGLGSDMAYYMKTDSEDDNNNEIKANAVNLENGMLVWFDEDEEIKRVHGKFVIEW